MENSLYYAPLNFIKQLNYINRSITMMSFTSIFKQRTTMHMRMYTRGWQAGGAEINQMVTFPPCFAYKQFMQY